MRTPQGVHARAATRSFCRRPKTSPRRLQNEKRKTIGIRVPDHAVPIIIFDELGEPIMSSTLILPFDEHPMTDGRDIWNACTTSSTP